MQYISKTGNRFVIDTPDELYKKFIGVVANLPVDNTRCPLFLYNTYFSALVVSLKDKMDNDKFRMPTLHGLAAKTL